MQFYGDNVQGCTTECKFPCSLLLNSVTCHSTSAHREAAVNGGGTSIGQVWCMVLTEESANAMFVSTYMRGEVSRI